jgi:hypothetical protein
VRGRVVFFGEQGKPAIEWAQAHYPEMKKYSEGGGGGGPRCSCVVTVGPKAL